MTWVDTVKSAMEKQGINQKELAKRTGITESSVCRYLKGDRKPRIDIVINFARELGLNVSELLELDGNNSAYSDIALVIARRGGELTDEEVNSLVQMLRGENIACEDQVKNMKD
ncbi:MAG: helix-turn-helix transcriptional regulator [Aeriscardovia sp.]|nr:helix-turn-helix transcriptional regulator [Aeriscardovia sp.]